MTSCYILHMLSSVPHSFHVGPCTLLTDIYMYTTSVSYKSILIDYLGSREPSQLAMRMATSSSSFGHMDTFNPDNESIANISGRSTAVLRHECYCRWQEGLCIPEYTRRKSLLVATISHKLEHNTCWLAGLQDMLRNTSSQRSQLWQRDSNFITVTGQINPLQITLQSQGSSPLAVPSIMLYICKGVTSDATATGTFFVVFKARLFRNCSRCLTSSSQQQLKLQQGRKQLTTCLSSVKEQGQDQFTDSSDKPKKPGIPDSMWER